jgi:8-oxo-dGTP pyrophosphatase MutT (NUDIX family)
MKQKSGKDRSNQKIKTRKQYAALPYAVRDGELVVMLVTSRETRRWIIPKGWPEKNLQGHEVAELEAFEEAGLVGEASPTPFASFEYLKRVKPTKQRRCSVDVFALAVREELDEWPEKGQRERVWLTPRQAADRVSDATLVELLLNFSSVVGVAA